jgi:hypothetical protein
MLKELQKFATYDQLDNYLSNEGYGYVLRDLYNMNWGRVNAEEALLAFWNGEYNPKVRTHSIPCYIMTHIKK